MLTPLTSDDPQRIGPFRLANRIGAGGMGVVYLGFGADGKPAAVKVPSTGLADNPEFRARFRQEVAAARRVRGTTVAAVFDADLTGQRPWMATEYVEGRSLADAVATRGRLDEHLVRGLAIGLADALVAIHEAGVVHRDLKPANILLAWDGPKVIDFGIALAADSTSHTRTGMLIGTLVWMAPEQLRGERAGAAADIFAWGACVAFAAAGRPPFRGERAEAVGMQILTAEPDLDGLPAALVGPVRDALAKEPEARPSAAGLLARLLGRDVGAVGDADDASETALAQIWSLPPTPPQGPPPAGFATGPGGPGGQGHGGAEYGAQPGADRGYPAGYDDRAQDSRGYDDRAQDSRGYDEGRYDNRGYRTSGPGAGATRTPSGPGAGYTGGGYGPPGPGSRPYAEQYAGGPGGYGPPPGHGAGRPGGSSGRRGAVIAAVLVAVLLLGGGIAAALALRDHDGGGSGGDGGSTATVGTGPAGTGTVNPSPGGGTAPSPPSAGATAPSTPSPATPTASQTPTQTPSPTPTTLSTDAAASVITGRGYQPDLSTYQEDRRLNVVVGTGQPSGGNPQQLAFVFADGQFRGTDTKAPSAHITLVRQPNDHEVTLRYDTYNPQDPPGAPSGHADVRFVWSGTTFTAQDPIPPNDPNAAGSRR
ncbi:eukaryotic-like serine/threonine-protein kinase [Frankia sp. AiPs1]|uniref:protein kinase domain-containing protein n=1 Tax=Frankia sp. AiPa1 TaxID=573492 RepID=UPI00202BA2BA|nr:LppP/LprE family lipoprotein [Frankia sp. AiPa1]MCL9759183.1 LppP/LprE family lipoprotein [Frankia sp. AiPa1]